MPQLQTEREGISLCIVQDKYIYAFGKVTTRGKRFKAVGGGSGVGLQGSSGGVNQSSSSLNQSTLASSSGMTDAQNLGKHSASLPTSNERYMEYNFERLDIDKLFQIMSANETCDQATCLASGLQWETLTVTSTFNIAKMPADKIPSFKNMGCFNHYKNKN